MEVWDFKVRIRRKECKSWRIPRLIEIFNAERLDNEVETEGPGNPFSASQPVEDVDGLKLAAYFW